MAIQKLYHFIVQGSGPFPVDMLRYDGCWPDRQNDVLVLTRRTEERIARADTREVRLVGIKKPTEARWASFSWTVHDIKELKV